jgi:hypothetical protein
MIDEIRWEPISRVHDRERFDCGNPKLEWWLRRYARKNHERGACSIEVLVPTSAPEHVIGFISLSASGIATSRAPESIRGFEHLEQIPAVLLGRMGRDIRYRGAGIGDVLLTRAYENVLQASVHVGVAIIVVDAKHGKAGWYVERGFVPTKDQTDRLVLPIKSIA